MFHLKRKSEFNKQTGTRHVRFDNQSSSDPRRSSTTYFASRSADETNIGRVRNQQAAEPDRRNPSYSKFWTLSSRAGVFLLAIVLFVVVIEEMTLSPTPKIVTLTTSTSQVFLRPPTVYQDAADALFAKSEWNRNKLTINTSAISDQLKRDFPELAAVSVALPLFGHYPTVYIQPSEPSLVIISQPSGSFVLNNNGVALLGANNQAAQLANLNVPTVVDQSGIPVSIGQTVLASTTVSFITTVAAQLHAQHIGFTSMVLPDSASELDVYLNGQPYYARFNTEDDSALQQVGALIAVMKHLQSQGITPHSYIDVMVDGRAYYK